jgi:hypothetical protein
MTMDGGSDAVGFTRADPFEGHLSSKSYRRNPELSLLGTQSLVDNCFWDI